MGSRVWTIQDAIALRDEILAKNLLLRVFTSHILPDGGAHVAGAVISAAAPLKPGDIVSAPVLQTARFGPAIHVRARVEKNERLGHTELKVVGMGTEYAITPDSSMDGWRPAVDGVDTE